MPAGDNFVAGFVDAVTPAAPGVDADVVPFRTPERRRSWRAAVTPPEEGWDHAAATIPIAATVSAARTANMTTGPGSWRARK
jgi:hypothetical protein